MRAVWSTTTARCDWGCSTSTTKDRGVQGFIQSRTRDSPGPRWSAAMADPQRNAGVMRGRALKVTRRDSGVAGAGVFQVKARAASESKQTVRVKDKGEKVRKVAAAVPFRTIAYAADYAMLEFCLVSNSAGDGYVFPKGGCRKDLDFCQTAAREAYEEAGIILSPSTSIKLDLEPSYTSKNAKLKGYKKVFVMEVEDVLEHWPEYDRRERLWVTLAEARTLVKEAWMLEALDEVEARLSELVQARTRTHMAPELLVKPEELNVVGRAIQGLQDVWGELVSVNTVAEERELAPISITIERL